MKHLAFLGFDTSSITEANLTIALVGYVIVFLALILLSLVFKWLPKLMNLHFAPKRKHDGQIEKVISTESNQIIGEEGAAIAAAIHMYFNEMHDEEDTVITINRTIKTYSPWNSKIYGVTRNLNRRF